MDGSIECEKFHPIEDENDFPNSLDRLQHTVNEALVVHSLRHAMRDRLRSIECPSDLIDHIGGWSRQTIGDRYGLGYSLHAKHKWLKLCTEGVD